MKKRTARERRSPSTPAWAAKLHLAVANLVDELAQLRDELAGLSSQVSSLTSELSQASDAEMGRRLDAIEEAIEAELRGAPAMEKRQ